MAFALPNMVPPPSPPPPTHRFFTVIEDPSPVGAKDRRIVDHEIEHDCAPSGCTVCALCPHGTLTWYGILSLAFRGGRVGGSVCSEGGGGGQDKRGGRGDDEFSTTQIRSQTWITLLYSCSSIFPISCLTRGWLFHFFPGSLPDCVLPRPCLPSLPSLAVPLSV